MSQDFNSFLQTLLAGGGQAIGQASRAVLPPVQQPMVGPMPVTQPVASPVQPPQGPIQGPSPVVPSHSPTMDPRTFAMYQQQRQQAPVQTMPPVSIQPPTPTVLGNTSQTTTPQAAQNEYPDTGAWQTVRYTGQDGKQYFILVPTAYLDQMPEGAQMVGDPIVNDPEAVQRAREAGDVDAKNPNAQQQRGLLSQMPTQIQALFGGGVYPMLPTEKDQPIDPNNTTQAPMLNLSGQDANAVQKDNASFDQLIQNVQMRGKDQVIAEQAHSQQPLTANDLKATNPEGAALLEANGIYSVRADQMVVQDQDGKVRLVPASETPPTGSTIITYGGKTEAPKPPEGLFGQKEIGNPLEWLGGLISEVPGGEQAMQLMEVPQRAGQSLFTGLSMDPPDIASWYKEHITDNAMDVFWQTPMGRVLAGVGAKDPSQGVEAGTYGFPAYYAWMQNNPELAQQVRKDGYNGFTGERAVWERFEADRNVFQRTMDSMTTDPVNLLPGGEGLVRRGAESAAERAIARGVGYTDEAADVGVRAVDRTRPVREISQSVDQTAPADFAQAPTVIEPPRTVQRGVEASDSTIDAASSELLPTTTRVEPPAPVHRGWQTTSDALNAVANVLQVPEQVLGSIMDGIVGPGRWGAEQLGKIPLGDGRTVSDLFRISDQSVVRNATDEFGNIVRGVQERPSRGVDIAQQAVDNAPVQQALPEVPAGAAIPNERIDVSAPENRIRRPEQAPVEPPPALAVDRPTTDLGQTPDTLSPTTTPELAVDRPTIDLANAPLVPEGFSVIPGDLPNTWHLLNKDGVLIPELRNLSSEQVQRIVGDPALSSRAQSLRPVRRTPRQEAISKKQADLARKGDMSSPEYLASVEQSKKVRASEIDEWTKRFGGASNSTETAVPSITNEVPPLRPDTEFQASDAGKKTQETIDSWPEEVSYLRPQTAVERTTGAGRLGEGFRQRPVDVARAIAPEEPAKWQRFLADYDRRAKRRYIPLERARQEKQFKHFQSRTFRSQREDGRYLRDAYEVMLEADNLVRNEGPLFVREFSDTAQLPDYEWKRWGYDKNKRPRTALDSLSPTGEYVPGTRLGEATELAIFHPDPNVRDAAFMDVELRLGQRDEAGNLVRTHGNPSLHTTLKKDAPELLDILSSSQKQNLSIRGLRRDYDALIQADRDVAARVGEDTRLTADDAMSLSHQNAPAPGAQEAVALNTPETPAPPASPAPTVSPVETTQGTPPARSVDPELSGESGSAIYDRTIDPAGAAVYDRTVAASALDDAATNRPPLPLGERAVSAIDAIPMGEPRSAVLPSGRTQGNLQVGTNPLEPNLIQGPNVNEVTPATDSLTDVEAVSPMSYGDAIRETNLRRKQAGTIGERVNQTLTAEPGTREAARQERYDQSAEGKAKKLEQTAPAVSRTDLDTFYIRGRAPSETEARVFSIKFNDGETVAARWDRYTEDYMKSAADVAEAEGLAASRVINDYTVEILPDDVRIVYDAEYKKIKKEKIDVPGEEGKTRPPTDLDAQIRALERVNRTGHSNKFWRGYDRFLSSVRKMFLYNWLTGPRYITGQGFGNSVTAVVTKNGDIVTEILSPRTIREGWALAHGQGESVVSVMDEALDGYGLGGDYHLIRGTNQVRDQTLDAAEDAALKKGNSLVGRYTPFLADKRIQAMAAVMDTRARESLFVHMMDRNMMVPRQELRDRMLATVPRGADRAEVERLFDALPSRFSSDDLRTTFGTIDSKWADRHARDWQESLIKTRRVAGDEVKRVFFDGTERNIDRALSRVVFFHYWMSRAVPLYTNAIARDPVLLNNFVRLQEAMQENDDLSGSKFVRFFSTPMGYNILIRPDAFLSTMFSLTDDMGYTPEGESMLGKMLRNSPVMINPLIQSALNITGTMGNTFGPDPVGANKFIQFAQMAIDNANAQFGWNLPPARNPQEFVTRHLRDFVSEKAAVVLPDWIAQHVEYQDEMAYRDTEIRSIIYDIALERGLGLDDKVVRDAMYDPSSELYREAMKRYARQDAMDIGMRILPVTAILYPKSQLASPKERTVQIANERTSQSQTGGFDSQYLQDRYTERDTLAATDEYSRNMQAWEDEYKGMGTPEQQAAFRFYNSIRYGGTTGDINVGGKTYTKADVAAMDDANRKVLADLWATETGNGKDIETLRTDKETFRNEHPEYAAFTEWSAQLNDYDGGPQQWAKDTAAGNPNFARWYNDLTPQQQQNDVVLTSLDAYMAYSGHQKASWDLPPTDTRGDRNPTPYNPIDGGGGSSNSSSSSSGTTKSKGPTQELIVQQIQQYEQDMQAYNAAASNMLGGQQVNVDWLNPQARSAVVSNLESVGVYKPHMGGYLYDYMQWVNDQPKNADTSVAAYLAWYAQTNPPQAPQTEQPAA